jgi:hypothetical protein
MFVSFYISFPFSFQEKNMFNNEESESFELKDA